MARPAAFIALLCASTLHAAPVPTKEITSNDIWAVAGNADTVWVLTARGVNFTDQALAASSGAISWQGFRSDRIRDEGAYGIAYGAGAALVPLAAGQSTTTNDVLVFSGPSAAATLRLPFATAQFENLDSATAAFFVAVDAAWLDGYWWLACVDGGVVRWGADTTIHYPGRDTAYTFATFTKQNFPHVPDSSDSQVISIEADPDAHILWVAQRRGLWRLRTDTLSWTMISDPAVDTSEIIDISVRDSHTVFATMLTMIAPDTSLVDTGYLYKFETADGVTWERSLFYSHRAPIAMTFLDSEHVYLVRKNDVQHWADIDTAGIVEQGFSQGCSYAAWENQHDVVSPVINDILYTTKQDTGLLWIATSEGLFLSFGKDFQPECLPNLQIVRRDKAVTAGLSNRNVYAFPSILNDSQKNSRAVFAYNLEKDDHVTIDIFDWNMDHVVRVVEDAFRHAGKNRPDGRARSTVASEDSWDGTFRNNNGARVTPGVYYFRITSEKNGRAFGKVVVAKP